MAAPQIPVPRLITGEQMTREEFIRRWEAIPDLKCAELIDGIVHVPSPVGYQHALFDASFHALLRFYAINTPGCHTGANGTWYMLESAPQPDAFLAIKAEAGGQSAIAGDFYRGAPELAVEICVTSTEVDFGPKLALYQRAGVREYVTIETFLRRIVWRSLVDGSYVEVAPDAGGVYRSRVFPGLWFDTAAFWADDGRAQLETLQRGLASPEHEAFRAHLASSAR